MSRVCRSVASADIRTSAIRAVQTRVYPPPKTAASEPCVARRTYLSGAPQVSRGARTILSVRPVRFVSPAQGGVMRHIMITSRPTSLVVT